MKKISLLGLMVFYSISINAMIIKDPKTTAPNMDKKDSYDIMPPYNPYSMYVPSKDILNQLNADRVLDIAASAYAANFTTKALYFYTNAIDIFKNDITTVSWATYEAGFIYFNKRRHKTALEYFDRVIQLNNAPTTVQNLAKRMASRIRNKKEYKTLLKQEDILFLADKKAQSILNKQIVKEENLAEKTQRTLSKERKRREKEEKRLLKEAEKAEKKRLKEEERANRKNT